MLLVLGLAFGADSVTALVFMPLLLCVLLLIACYVEQEADFTGPLQNSRINAAIVGNRLEPFVCSVRQDGAAAPEFDSIHLVGHIPILPVLITLKDHQHSARPG